MGRIFIGFGGPKTESKNYDGGKISCWSLATSSLESFIDEVKKVIPPINDNITDENYFGGGHKANFGLGIKEIWGKVSWGILIQDDAARSYTDLYERALFLINVFSPSFLYPIFYVSHLGAHRISYDHYPYANMFGWPADIRYHNQNQFEKFAAENLELFFNNLLPQSIYVSNSADRLRDWTREEWSIFAAAILFEGLKTYDSSKSPFLWQREAADISAIAEALCVEEKEELRYRLGKRCSVLVESAHFNNVEGDIKKLYTLRSEFVHGKFGNRIRKGNKGGSWGWDETLLEDFEFLERQVKLIRFLFAGYLKLKSESDLLGGYGTVQSMLETAIIDTNLRARVNSSTQAIFALMPEI